MKKITIKLFAVMSLLIGFQAHGQIQTGPASSYTTCDGWAALNPNSGFTSWTWIDNGTKDTLQVGGDSLLNLCQGYYDLSYFSDSIGNGSLSFYIDTLTSNVCANFYASIDSIMMTSSYNSCDGSAMVMASGGTAPYTYSWSNGAVGALVEGLCYGNIQVFATDANGCSYTATAWIDSLNTNGGGDSTDCSGFGIELLYVNNISSPNVCDGSASIMVYGGTPDYTYIWSNNETGTTVDNLCAGSYTVSAMDAAGCQASYSIYVDIDSSNWSYPLDAFVYPSEVSTDGACDGTAYVEVWGGTAPYNFDHSNGQTTQYVDGLCAGVHTVIVTDAAGDSIIVSYVVASPINVIDDDDFQDSTVVDTLVTDLFENCDLTYFDIDSAFISAVEFVTNDSIIVTWSVVDANGTITVTDSYALDLGYGIYEFILQLFCPQRGTGDYLVAHDRIMINPNTLGIQKETMTNVSVFPNPFGNQLTVQLPEADRSQVSIVDVQGRVVFQSSYEQKQITINTSELTAGQYFVHIQTNKAHLVKKLIK
ncbi:MAG: T9SS type A sorting domain-containing protein [Bacteroidetes bacterium]|nr:MAG: T9SS type A sorting domain-containing protein [Bacteroidota bacterium]